LAVPEVNSLSVLSKVGGKIAKKAGKAAMQYAKEQTKKAARDAQKKMAKYLRQKAKGALEKEQPSQKEKEIILDKPLPFAPKNLELQIQKSFRSKRVLDIYFLLLKSQLFSTCGRTEEKEMFCLAFEKMFAKRNSPIFNELMEFLENDNVFTEFAFMLLYLSANHSSQRMILKTKYRIKNSYKFETFIARCLRIQNPALLTLLKYQLRSFYERDANTTKILIDSLESCQTSALFEVFFTKIFDKSEQKEFGGFVDLLLARQKFALLSGQLIQHTLRRPFLVDLPTLEYTK
jgi:hypothetical protein